MKSFWFLALFTAMIATGSAQPLGMGEQRLNSAIYKSSHNSYDRHESLAQQIDAYNVWQIELDIYDFQGSLKVNHDCDPASISSASTLEGLLQKMMTESVTFRSRFTIIYLDMKGNGNDGCAYSWGSQIGQRLTDAFVSILGAASIYPSSQFIQQDNLRWPSHQDLVRRGFNWSIIVDWHGTAPQQGNPQSIFFTVTLSDRPDSSQEARDAVLVNVDGGCDASPTSEAPQVVNFRWLYRCYPGSCGQACAQLDGAYWQNALAKGYNLIATNCIDRDHTFQSPTQSPDPLFVAVPSSIKCPQNYATCEWGTITFPYHDVARAVNRASPMATLLVQPGQYAIRFPGGLTINHPLILKVSRGGAAVFQ